MMSLKFKCLLVVCLALNFSFSQNNQETLLEVDGEAISAAEFIRVYKKNLDLVQDESQKNIDGYLKLFTEYQLKLKEAKRLKLDEEASYQREFKRYKKQLIKNYISDNEATDALVKEAYERSNIDLNASHILVLLKSNAKDTINAYNQVLALRKRALKEGFDNLKPLHNGKTIFVEDLGYFSAFKMVYDFESAAFNTPKGEISMPFRTQFGYHVVKVNDRRPSRGTLTAAHIMVNFKSKDSLIDPEERINTIYKKIQQGESFESLAKQFSDDKNSANKGGKLAPFKSGQLSSTEFEDAAFGLEHDGDITAPFKSAFGWHIVKRIDLQPVPSFEDSKSKLELQVKRDTRSKLIDEAMVEKLKSKYEITYNDEAKAYFTGLLNEDYYKRSWELPKDFKANTMLFKINKTVFTYGDFGTHLKTAERRYSGKNIDFSEIVDKEFHSFFKSTILQYREDNLEVENEEYAHILKEYRDGLLLFDLMEQEVWNKAAKDTIGLEEFYEKNKANYQWGDRVEVVIASSADQGHMRKIRKLMKKEKSQAAIKAKINTDEEQNVMFTKGTYPVTDPLLPSNFEVKEGVSKVYENHDAFHVIDVKSVLPAGQKTLEEAKGSVINDYQTEIELNWINQLYERYNITVNEATLQAVKAQLEN